MLEIAIKAIDLYSKGFAVFCMIVSRLSKKFIFSIPFTTSFIADRLRIVIRIASKETSVYVLLLLNLKILMIDFMLRSVKN